MRLEICRLILCVVVADEPSEEAVPQAPRHPVAARVGGTRRNRTMRAQAEYARRLRDQVLPEENEEGVVCGVWRCGGVEVCGVGCGV